MSGAKRQDVDCPNVSGDGSPPGGDSLPVAEGGAPAVALDETTIAGLERILGHRFRDHGLARQALTHSSSKTLATPSNERLEFFGDAVLGLIITEILYHRCPDYPEGEMTRVRSELVSREKLAHKAVALGFHRYAIFGKGVGSRESLPRSVLANLFEAMIAALYVDGGYEACRTFIEDRFYEDIAPLLGRVVTRNYKSALQQLAQSRFGTTPVYEVVNESGPDHEKRFGVSAMIGERRFPVGEGGSKKESEQTAARLALKELLATLDLGDADAALMLELPLDDEGDHDDHVGG